MSPRELMDSAAELVVLVLGYLEGPFALRDPAKASSWRVSVASSYEWLLELQKRGYDPEPGSEWRWIHAMDKLLSWCLPLLPLLRADAPAAREKLRRFVDIVLTEGTRHGERPMVTEYVARHASRPT